MDKILNIFIIIISLNILLINNSFGKTVKDILDLIPIDDNINFLSFETSFLNKSNLYSINLGDGNINSPEVLDNYSFDFGYKRTENINYTIDLNYSINNNKLFYSPKINKNSFINTRFSIFSKNNRIPFPGWKYYSQVSMGRHNFESIECFEGKKNIIKKVNSNCSNLSKKIKTINGNPVKLDGNIYSVGFGLRKTTKNWSDKNTFDIGINTYKIKYKKKLDASFSSIDEDYLKYFPQGEQWITNNAHFKISKSRRLNKDWGWGVAATYYKVWLSNYVSDKEIKTKNNIVLDAKISRKFRNNLIISFGGLLSSNYLIGFTPHELRGDNEGLAGQNYAEAKVTIGYVNKNHLNFNEINQEKISKIDVLYSSHIERKSSKNKNLKKAFIKKIVQNNHNSKNYEKKISSEENKNEKLINYALNFAKKVDKNSFTLFEKNL